MRTRPDSRKVNDSDLIRLNSLGFSLSTIAATLGCHKTTASLRLKDLGIPPADTRRTFMEDIIIKLPTQQLEWLEQQLGPHHSIKDFVRTLLTNAYLKSKEEHDQR